MLAIIIPYYNHTFFETTLQSLVNQTNNRFKVYIGDDASIKNPTVLLEKYEGKFEFVYHRFETNVGGISLTKQWERCIALSKSEEWLMILGDDDKLDSNCVELFYTNIKEIDKLNIDVIRFSSIKINEVDKTIAGPYTHPIIEKSTDFLFRWINGTTRSSLSEYVFRKESFQKNGFKNFPLAWFSDILAILEFSNFENIFFINDAIVYIRLSGLNISSRADNLVLKNIATFKFYHYLIEKKQAEFNKEEMEILYLKLEKCFLDNKKNLHFWVQLTKMYILRNQLKRYFLFLGKVFKAVFKKK